MTYRVIITANAKDNLRQAYERAADHAPRTAARWLNRFQAALQTLSSHPQRCSLAPENALVEPEIRQFLFGKGRNVYRAPFAIREDEVLVLHGRWGGMEFATEEDISM